MFNYDLLDLIDGDMQKILDQINKNGILKTSRSVNPDVDPLDISLPNISELLQRVTAFESPEDILKGITDNSFMKSINSIFALPEGGALGMLLSLLPGDIREKIGSVATDATTAPTAPTGGGAEGETIEGGDPVQLSPNFKVSDFNSNRGAQVPTEAIPGLRWLCVNVLEPMISEFGACTITSPFRTTAHNKSVSSSGDRSRHIYYRYPNSPAVDVRFARGGPDAWLSAARGIIAPGRGGFGRYSGNFIHIDNRPSRTNWDWR